MNLNSEFENWWHSIVFQSDSDRKANENHLIAKVNEMRKMWARAGWDDRGRLEDNQSAIIH